MTEPRLTLLILGGYGTFGGRLARLLAPDPDLTLIIAGRSADKAAAFIATLPAGAALHPLALDRAAGIDEALRRARPDIVVDATGPFQAYGPDPYRVVRAAVAYGTNYLDLADGSAFVEGIATFDAEALAKGVFVLSGVSSFPVLTAAVVRALGADLAAIDTVVGGIAPSPYAGVGLNVIRAIMSYAGQPIPVVRNGADSTAYALTEHVRATIAPPGRLPLKSTRFSLVDVPDLLLIPRAMPQVGTLWAGAGPVPELLHRLLSALAWLVRLRLVPTLAPLAPLAFWAINTFRWGEHRGGMFVELRGTTAGGTAVQRSWHMLAEGDDGPLIPSMAVAIIVRKMLEGIAPDPGARAATTALALADYERMFADRTIHTGVRDDTAIAAQPLYRQILGDAWDAVPLSLRLMHDIAGAMVARGTAKVVNGPGLVAALVRRLFGFPRAADAVPLSVTFTPQGDAQLWTRQFGRSRFMSLQRRGRGHDDRLIVEQFGPIRVSLALVLADGRLRLVVRRWNLFGLPLPLALAPNGDTSEFEESGRFNFDVEIRHPWLGLIVAYSGELGSPEPVGASG